MEERTIKLTLDNAKEWYKKGGELKEVALQAYTEEELTKVELPRTWGEFLSIDNYTKTDKSVFQHIAYLDLVDRLWDSGRKKEYLAHFALMKLHLLRDCYRQGWVPDWEDSNKKYVIERYGASFDIDWYADINYFLAFQTEELAEKFLNNFRDLIEKARDLI